jgi:GntR family transcriptional regulator, transcriptional repressor for pyruvate dehydrogenase complex
MYASILPHTSRHTLSTSTSAVTQPSAPFEPIQTRRTFEEICARIRARINSGELKPGDKLPAERDLAQQLGVGRNALREALRSLEIAGMLEFRKGVKGGAFIRSGDPARMDAVVQDMLSLGSITIGELAETRIHIQDLVVRLACERAGEEDFLALEANIARTDEMTRSGRFLDRIECSREFYRLLGAATRNAVLAMMVQSVTEILMQFVYARVAAGGKPTPRLVPTRREFVEALRARDAERATAMMRKHLDAIHRMLEQSLANKGASFAASRRGAA